MTFTSLDKFRESPFEDARLCKDFSAEVRTSDTARELSFVISTAGVDRMGDTIAVDGWDVAGYLKNPVVLWAHDYTSLPVAKATKVWSDPTALHATVEWTPAGLVRFNDIVFDLYRGGFLNAVSVSFRPTKWAFTEDKDRRMGIDFAKQELLEFSAVPVPANPAALIEARGAGVDLDPLRDWACGIIGKLFRPQTVREFEGMLRDVAFSQKEARDIASHGFRCPHWEGEADPATKQADVRTAEQMKAINDLRAIAILNSMKRTSQ